MADHRTYLDAFARNLKHLVRTSFLKNIRSRATVASPFAMSGTSTRATFLRLLGLFPYLQRPIFVHSNHVSVPFLVLEHAENTYIPHHHNPYYIASQGNAPSFKAPVFRHICASLTPRRGGVNSKTRREIASHPEMGVWVQTYRWVSAFKPTHERM